MTLILEDYKTCKIAPSQVSLEELAGYFVLDPGELRWFHNRFCPIEDLIDPVIQSHTEIIYVPVPGVETGYYARNHRNKPLYEKLNTLQIPRSFEKTYGITQTIYINETEKSKLHYQTEIKKTAKDRLIISRQSMYINHKRPEMVMEQIADIAGEVFYPLQLELYDNGKLKFINNFPEIQKRWKEKKATLSSCYKGQIADQLLDNLDNQLQYRGKIQRGILDSWFFVLYFFPLYEEFNEDKTYNFQIGLPIFPRKPRVLFDITLSIDETITETQKLTITARGKCADPRTLEEIINGKSAHDPEVKGEKVTGNFDFTYKLNARDNSIAALWGEVNLKLNEDHRKIVFDLYQL